MSNEFDEKVEEKKCCCGHHNSDSCCGEHTDEDHQCCGNHADEDHHCCGEHAGEDHQCGCGCGHHDTENSIPDIEDIPDVPFPEPTLQSFSESIGTQALVSLGLIPNPMTGKPVVRLNQAKHLIDSIQLLFEKTEGNRTSEETQFMEGILHELHMIYISVQQKKS